MENLGEEEKSAKKFVRQKIAEEKLAQIRILYNDMTQSAGHRSHRIIIRCMVLHERDVTERQLAALISKAIGQNYSHQAVHKRIPAAAKRLAELMNYPY